MLRVRGESWKSNTSKLDKANRLAEILGPEYRCDNGSGALQTTQAMQMTSTALVPNLHDLYLNHCSCRYSSSMHRFNRSYDRSP
eukprot:scaffold4717_cov274-Pinguiococcus_pyrenoidosus.AAC.7